MFLSLQLAPHLATSNIWMPFGLRNAVSTFQQSIDSLFRDMDFIVIYIDDLLIFSKNKDLHDQYVKTVCERLLSEALKINKKEIPIFLSLC